MLVLSDYIIHQSGYGKEFSFFFSIFSDGLVLGARILYCYISSDFIESITWNTATLINIGHLYRSVDHDIGINVALVRRKFLIYTPIYIDRFIIDLVSKTLRFYFSLKKPSSKMLMEGSEPGTRMSFLSVAV